MRLLTAVSGVRVPQQAPKKKPAKVSFLFCYFCYYLEPPTLFSACTTPACRTDAENALFRRTECSLRGFESLNRRQKRNLLRFLFYFFISFIISNPLRCFRPARLPRAEQMSKTRYSVALCAPYGGSCPRASARKEAERLLFYFFISVDCFFFRTFDFSVSFGSDVQRAEGKGGG